MRAVVTVCRDPGEAIAATAASIAAQSAPLRWIVVDGASRDGTPERLRALPRPPDALVSEADAGIADAFNKGLTMAGGDEVLFLNAGDAFVRPEALADLARAWDRPRYRWVAGGVLVCDAHGRELAVRRPDPALPARRLVARGNRIPHPAVLAEAGFLRRLGGFDQSYRYAMDYEMWLRAIADGQPPQITGQVVARFALGGRSGDVRARLAEDRRARQAYKLSDGFLAETWLATGAWARILAGPLRRAGWAYRLNRWLGW